MKRVLSLATCLVLGSASLYAGGTDAGTTVNNSATLSYTIGGTPTTGVVSNTDSFVVDRKINLTVAWSDSSNVQVLSSGDSDKVLTFSVTNTGNDTQDFALSVTQVSSGDQFDVSSYKIYVESDGTNGWSVTDSEVATIDDLAKDGSQTVYIVSTTPSGLNNNDLSKLILTATAKASDGSALTETTSADTTGVDNVFADGAGDSDANRDAKHSSTGTYQVVASGTVNVSKSSCVVNDPVNGTSNPKRIPGATIRYAIEVSNTAASDATGVTVTDNLTTNLSYSGNAKIVSGACSCASAAGTAISGDTVSPSGQDVSMNFNTVTTASQECAYFEVTIN